MSTAENDAAYADLDPGTADLGMLTGAELLEALRESLRTYVILPSENAYIAVTLWIVATHGQPYWQNATRLVINSPEKRCGKSRLLEIIDATCHRPLMTANISTAVLYRVIKADDPPTILLDEADTIFGTKVKAEQNEDLRGLINAGYSKHLPVWRCVGNSLIPTQFATYAMAAVAGIGTMPDTITDRAVNVTMRRRAKGETVQRYRASRDVHRLHDLRDQIREWITDNADHLAGADPSMPLQDRAADNWCSLIAVADLAGGSWPAAARAAAEQLTAAQAAADNAESLNVMLLGDIKAILQNWTEPFISSKALATMLRSDENGPWNDPSWELTPRRLTARLKGFGITPGHNTAKTARGYKTAQFTDAIARYVPEPSAPDTENPDPQ